MNPKSFLKHCQSDLPDFLRCLREAVEIESPTNYKTGIDRMARYFGKEFKKSGGKARILQHPTAGSCVSAEFWSETKRQKTTTKPILLLGHLDTVWEVGTIRQMPFRIRGGRAYGPGTLDMKAGILCGLWAIRSLQALGMAPSSPIHFFLNSDEETASLAFREQMLAEARASRAVLVLEPAATGGALKTQRKGVGQFTVKVRGQAAHAGVDPGAGVNAIVELARQILCIEKLSRSRGGLTLNVGIVQGGSRPNVVPELASALVDVRVPGKSDGEAIERKMSKLRAFHPKARVEVAGGINRPPMERRRTIDLFRKAKELGKELGMDLKEASTGGGSDGSLTAALGVPTLDGLGAVGEGAHARHEHVVIPELPRRAALLAALIATL